MKPISECKSVYELLESPERWTKLYTAVDVTGEPIYCESDKACKFCLLGAIIRVYSGNKAHIIGQLQNYLEVGSIALFNDDPKTTHADVLALVKEAGI
jgi:hypothetical protein